ncbi:lactadherin-like [Ruditapes philippinarum]|uniref:lactadherin-like n=1 Tax=Ruditapes philippinarum TaxID=129788 RepID=UPI00295B7F69|nr:lactadherin-like [Ruditapes philippinarum]
MKSDKNMGCWLTPNDSYRKYKCVKSSVLAIPFMVCSLKCCLEHRCIGLYFKEISEECYLINSIVKEENCPDLDWNSWKAYKKQKVLGECVQYLGLAVNQYTPEQTQLNFVPGGNGDIGGHIVVGVYTHIVLRKFSRVRGFAIQGRWRNESLESCCDDRVTYYNLHASVDCYNWIWADNKTNFEANVIPDAGNEAVVNLFQTPFDVACLSLYPTSHHGERIVRFDMIGCEL